MKKIVYLAVIAIFVLASCKDSGQQKQPDNTPAEGQAAVLDLEFVYGDTLQITSLAVYPDSLVVTNGGVNYAYAIDKENSYEEIEPRYYIWNYAVNAVDPQAVPFAKIAVKKFMTDIFGEKGNWDRDDVLFWKNDGKGADTYTLKNEISLGRKILGSYPESQPYPEMVMENADFVFAYGIDTAKVPGIVRNAKTLVIKDRTFTLSDGKDSVVLNIIPLSDYETVYSEGYDWYFTTEATDKLPSMQIQLNSGFDFVRQQSQPENRWIALYIGDYGYYNFDFKSWENLQRKLSVCYPSDEDFNHTMEEGILPDVSDED